MIGVYYRWDTGVHDIHKVKQELSRHCFTNISLQSITVFLLHNAAKYQQYSWLQWGWQTWHQVRSSALMSLYLTVSERELQASDQRGHETTEPMWKHIITLDKMWTIISLDFAQCFAKPALIVYCSISICLQNIRLIPRTAFSRYWVIVNEVSVVVTGAAQAWSLTLLSLTWG